MMDPNYSIERRVHKNQIIRWKMFSVFLITVLAALFVARGYSDSHLFKKEYIGSVLIDELIYEDNRRDENLEKLAETEEIKALIVKVNTGGGTATGSEKIYHILRKIALKKPIVVVMGSMAASGGYMITLAADHIIAHNTTATGSIGVVMQSAEITEMAEKLGIRFESFKSGELKFAPSPTEKTTPAVREAVMEAVEDNYKFFIGLVSERRGMPLEEVRQIADGRVYTGRQALKLKLIDAIGTDSDALKWLQEVKGLDSTLKVKNINIKHEYSITDVLLEEAGVRMMQFINNKLQGLKAIF